jgi:hypothetical protein
MMGMAYDAKGDRTRALEMYNRVLKIKDIAGTHADARRYIALAYKK